MSDLSPPPSVINRFPLDTGGKSSMLPAGWITWFNEVYNKLRGPLWGLAVAEIGTRGRAGAGAGPGSQANVNGGPYQGDVFAAGQSKNTAFLMNHQIKPGSVIYPFVGWTTGGTESGTVTWKVHHQLAQGHNQAAFPTSTTITFTAAATSGTAWQHMTALCNDTDAITMPEPGTALLMNVEMDATTLVVDNIYGLFTGFYYQKDRFGTPKKVPDFYQY